MASSIRTWESSAGVFVQICGVIDESFDLSSMFGRWHGCIVFDLSEVERVTSFGVREWMRALDSLRVDYYCFVRCSPSVVCQFNLVANFAGRGELISLYAPYRCESCGEETKELYDMRRESVSAAPPEAREVTCKCGQPAEFDDVPDMYFDYVSSVPSPRPPASALGLIDGRPMEKPKFRAEKTVQGAVTVLKLSGPIDRSAYFKRLADGLQGDVVVTLADASELNDDGRKGLIGFLAASGVSFHLAMVPVALIQPIGEMLANDRKCKARVVSLSLPFYCASCDRMHPNYMVQGQVLTELKGNKLPPCPTCQNPMVLNQEQAIFGAIAALPTITPTEAVMAATDATGDGSSAVSRRHLLLGKYKIERPIGRGGMGEVLLARHLGPASFEKFVVLKRIRRDILESAQIVESFLREARIAAQLSHRNIVQIFDLGRVEDEYLIAMEHVVGIDLLESLRVSRAEKLTWPVTICCRVVSELCAALQAAHSHRNEDGTPSPIVHRDVSPSNILLAAEGTVKLTDFGVAKAMDRSKTTETGVFKGKRAYAAPEQLLGSSSDPRIDIYAAGVVLYECLTLRRFSVFDPRVFMRTVEETPTLGIRPDISPRLNAAFEKAVAYHPEDRYATAQDFRNDLELVLQETRTAASDDLAAWVNQLMAIAQRHRQSNPGGDGVTMDSDRYDRIGGPAPDRGAPTATTGIRDPRRDGNRE